MGFMFIVRYDIRMIRCDVICLISLFYSARSLAGFQPNIGFTLRRVLAVFTRSAVTPPKVNRFG